MATMEDVAVRAGVSQATVSYVLGGRADRQKISMITRERILKAASELSYQRNQLARAMVTGKSRIIACLTPPDASENITRIITGAMSVASEKDYLLKAVNFSYFGADDATIARCLEWRLAGALIVGFNDETLCHLDETFYKNQIPVSLVDNLPVTQWGGRVYSDDGDGFEQVIAHLSRLGHRRIAYLGGTRDELSLRRERCFTKAMASVNLSVPPCWLRHSSWWEQDEIEEQIAQFFKGSNEPSPTAIVCAADSLAMLVARYARSIGLCLPRDLSITGYSNADLSRCADPPLTTVDQSFHEVGRAAAQQIISFIEQGGISESTVPKERVLPVRLIERGSTAPPPPNS